jgi:hypothetical protein
MVTVMKFESSGPPLTPGELTKFEHELGCALPSDYRHFLLKTNGGVPCVGHFFEGSGKSHFTNHVVRFFCLRKRPNRDLREEVVEARRHLPKDYLPVGRDLAGETLCLRLTAKDYGALYVTDGYAEHLGHRPHLRRLSHSFRAFLDLLFDKRALEPFDEIYHLAEKGTKTDLLKYLANGGSVNDSSSLGMPLALSAAAHGNLAVLKTCIGLGADITGALTVSILNHKWEAMQFLLEAGANANEVYAKTGKRPIQSIYGVPETERDRIVQFLKAHGAHD